MKAIWQNTVIAESNDTILIEGNHYFPEKDVNQEYLVQSDHTTVCHWKGTANYFSVKVGDKINENAAWYYADPSEMAKGIKNRIAFWKGVEVVK